MQQGAVLARWTDDDARAVPAQRLLHLVLLEVLVSLCLHIFPLKVTAAAKVQRITHDVCTSTNRRYAAKAVVLSKHLKLQLEIIRIQHTRTPQA